MGAYSYEVMDKGKKVSGQLEAESRDAAARLLRQQGLTIVSVEEGGRGLAGKDLAISNPFGGVKARELTLFSRQFATMVASGLTILRSMSILEEQVESKKLKEVIAEVASDIEQGRSLSEALEKHPKVFDNLYVSMVEAGEAGGVLDMTLERVATQLEARDSLKRKVKSAMAYPTVVLVFAILATIGMIKFLVPIFADMYESLDSELPALTQVLVDLAEWMENPFFFMLMIGALVAAPVAFRNWKRSDSGRRVWDRMALRFPMKIGMIVQKLALARFSRILASLIASGVPMMAAVRVTGESSGSSVIEDAMDDVIRSIEEGRSFSDPLEDHDIFPSMVIQMTRIGEETGKLDAMLEKVAEFYEDEVDAAIKGLTSIIEPIMMVFVGGIVGVVIVALYLPMFQLFDAIQ